MRRTALVLWLCLLGVASASGARAFSTPLLDGSVAVDAMSQLRYTVSVPPLIMANPRIEGSLRASGGLGNDIKVYVFTEVDYTNWANGHEATPLYQSGQVSAADLNVSLPGDGRYVLVLSNSFSLMTAKTLAGDVALRWDFPFALVLVPLAGVMLVTWGAGQRARKQSKPTREWSFSLADPHSVTLTHGAVSGQVVIALDGREVFRRESKVWDTGLEHRFEVEGKPCIVRIIARSTHADYELWVDGKLQ